MAYKLLFEAMPRRRDGNFSGKKFRRCEKTEGWMAYKLLFRSMPLRLDDKKKQRKELQDGLVRHKMSGYQVYIGGMVKVKRHGRPLHPAESREPVPEVFRC